MYVCAICKVSYLDNFLSSPMDGTTSLSRSNAVLRLSILRRSRAFAASLRFLMTTGGGTPPFGTVFERSFPGFLDGLERLGGLFFLVSTSTSRLWLVLEEELEDESDIKSADFSLRLLMLQKLLLLRLLLLWKLLLLSSFLLLQKLLEDKSVSVMSSSSEELEDNLVDGSSKLSVIRKSSLNWKDLLRDPSKLLYKLSDRKSGRFRRAKKELIFVSNEEMSLNK